jgi:hypothetical protein
MGRSFGVESTIVGGRMYYVEYLNNKVDDGFCDNIRRPDSDEWVKAAQFIHEHDAEGYAANMRNHLKDVRVRKAVRCVGGACGD